MRLITIIAVASVAALAACDTPTASRCDAVPSRVVDTRGDTAVTVSALKYIEQQVGTGETVRSCSAVQVKYTGWLTDGTSFDNGTIDVIPGVRSGMRVIPGFEQALIGMQVGGKRRAIIPSELGYGAGGQGSIPGNATLIFDIEVLKVEN